VKDTRVLIVEDEVIVAHNIAGRLRGLGYIVPAMASSGAEALRWVAEAHPDVVLMDIKLQGPMDGIETAAEIRALLDIPVIYLTAYADAETLQRAKVTEPYGYILKPFQERELQTAIEIALYKHRAEQRLKEAETQLRQAEKLEAVGLLAAGMAHHFNNLMAIVVGYASLLLDSHGEDEDLRRSLETIMDAGQRAGTLTRQLLAFSRKHMLRPETHDLNQVVTSLREVLLRQLGADVTLELVLSPGPARAEVDAAQVEQVVVNLANNARQAMPGGGTFTIRVDNVTLDAEGARTSPEARPGQFVRLEATDTGVGMDAGTVQRIFEPFFSTDLERMGLGLSVAYGIVKQHGGWIQVQSEPGHGSTFTVYLPVSLERPGDFMK
jgi:signal transduction histidine kinase